MNHRYERCVLLPGSFSSVIPTDAAAFKLQDENRVNYLIAGFVYVGIRATWVRITRFSNVCSQHCPQIDAPALRT